MEITEFQKEILLECLEDRIGLWSIIWTINGDGYSTTEVLPDWVRQKTIETVRNLLQQRLVEAGNFEAGSYRFQPMVSSVEETIDYIEREWNALGRNPTIGDVCWFRATAAGEQLAQQILAAQNDNVPAN
jgi:hypothetical protein